MNEQYQDDVNKIQLFPNGKLFRLVYDATTNCLRLLGKTRDIFEEIREAFSVKNKAAFFSQQYGYKGEPRLYNINQFGFFQPGLVFDIFEWIKTQYGSLAVVAISQSCANYIKDWLMPLKPYFSGTRPEISNIADESGINDKIRDRIEYLLNSGDAEGELKRLSTLELRPYQKQAIEALLFNSHGRGMIEIPTAGGKSFIISNFIWNVLKLVNSSYKTLILVPNVQLVEQFYSDMLSYGFNQQQLAKFEGGMSKREKKQNDIHTAKIVIANRQYVFKNEKLLPQFDIMICDECHSCCAESSSELISRIGPKIRVGCSGTIPSDKYQLNQLIGMFGKVAYREDITALQDDGFISKLKITSIEIIDKQVEADRNLLFHVNSTKKYVADDPDSEIRFDDAVKAEHEYISNWYADLYSPVLDYVSGLTGNTLVLFDKLDIGNSLYELFKTKYPDANAFYNDGSTDVKIREDTRASLERTDGNVLFANVQILSTGVSIKRLHNLVFCFSSKSTVRIIQSCGRALRLHGDKKYANLYDVHFNFKYSDRHYKERLQLYKQFYNKTQPDNMIYFKV